MQLYQPNCRGLESWKVWRDCLESVKERFGFRVKLPPAYHIPWKFHTILFVAERQAVNTDFYSRWFDPTGIEPESTVL